jgi:hypothetical protein
MRSKGIAPTEERVLHLYQVRMAQRPTQTEIPRVMPAFNPGGTLMDAETRMYGGSRGGAPRASGPGMFPANTLPPRALPRVIDDPWAPLPPPPARSGPISRPLPGNEIAPNDVTPNRLRWMLGL